MQVSKLIWIALPMATLVFDFQSTESPSERSFEAVDRLIEAWQPTSIERRFDNVGWVSDIRTAIRLGNEHRRPVFVFTHNGRMAVGRQ